MKKGEGRKVLALFVCDHVPALRSRTSPGAATVFPKLRGAIMSNAMYWPTVIRRQPARDSTRALSRCPLALPALAVAARTMLTARATCATSLGRPRL